MMDFEYPYMGQFFDFQILQIENEGVGVVLEQMVQFCLHIQ